ncbi:MAG TPA: FAD/NAD(P)-binding protein, partial [Polyangiales bacterium]
MQPTALEADYLVIGSGAMGMAFVDVLLAETTASVVLVDRHHRPGGHWNDAYSFVRLHSPACYYGVASTPLGSGQVETSGGNAGLLELASGRELSAYYDQVLEQRLLPTGRLHYFSMCDYRGDGEFVSLLSGQRTRVAVRKKLVDATFTRTEVPSTHAPKYAVGQGVRCVPINELVRIGAPAERYVVIGAGKTGIDACLWLLERDVPPAAIRWIRPRDTWLHNRARLQPATLGPVLLESGAAQMEEAARALSLDDLFLRLEARGELLRIDGQ